MGVQDEDIPEFLLYVMLLLQLDNYPFSPDLVNFRNSSCFPDSYNLSLFKTIINNLDLPRF